MNEEKVLTRGVTKNGMRGIPPCITKQELKSKKSHIDNRGTVYAEVTKGDTKCPNLIESSVYETDPSQYVSIVPEDLKQDVRDKQ